MRNYDVSALVITAILTCSVSFAASAVNIPTGDITVTNGDINLSAPGSGILFPGPSGGRQTIPFTGSAITATSASTAVSATSAVTAQSADTAAFAATAGILTGQYFSEDMSIGCSGTTAVACPSSCISNFGTNTCQISKLNSYPIANWTRIAFIEISSPGTYVVETDPTLIRCFNSDRATASSIALEVRMQNADFTGQPPQNWPNDATNHLLAGQFVATETGGGTWSPLPESV